MHQELQDEYEVDAIKKYIREDYSLKNTKKAMVDQVRLKNKNVSNLHNILLDMFNDKPAVNSVKDM